MGSFEKSVLGSWYKFLQTTHGTPFSLQAPIFDDIRNFWSAPEGRALFGAIALRSRIPPSKF